MLGKACGLNFGELQTRLEADARLQRVHLDLAHPGEPCRIGRVFDVMAPRAKMDGDAHFPGVLGQQVRAGRGRMRALADVANVATGLGCERLRRPAEGVMIGQVGATTLEVLQGDITECAVDAIVNAANNHLWMGAGVAGAIKRKGGRSIEDEAVRQGPIAVGEAVVTAGGSLKARYVIHAAAMGQDLMTNADLIRHATVNSLKRATELGLASMALPALGTGVGGFPVHEAARLMIDATCRLLRGTPHTSLTRVQFVLFTPDALQAFEEALTTALR